MTAGQELPGMVGEEEVATPRCRLCGRPLRNPVSIAAQVGPTCFAKAARLLAPGGRRRRRVRVLELQLPLDLTT